jgi:hypothetical protein
MGAQDASLARQHLLDKASGVRLEVGDAELLRA